MNRTHEMCMSFLHQDWVYEVNNKELKLGLYKCIFKVKEFKMTDMDTDIFNYT